MVRSLGFDVVRYRAEPDPALTAFELLLKLRGVMAEVEDKAERELLVDCAKHIADSKSQLFQDVFALHVLHGKPRGYFVEFGAADGVVLSNTHLMETRYAWDGILAEPGRVWKAALEANRRCAIDERCVWTTSSQTLQFLEAAEAELSTIDPFAGRDSHSAARAASKKYEVETISLTDLLRAHDAPNHIDYVSVDTEGSEFPILSKFDFDAFEIDVITVEHNFIEADRRGINELLVSKGFRRVFEKFSRWDDWYVKKDLGPYGGDRPAQASSRAN